MNASFNCVDRHLGTLGERTAILWAAGRAGSLQARSRYRELKHNVCRIANVLLSHGVKRGDRVCIYMSMIPELAYTMLACARIGAVHSVVFGGFSADSLRDRIVDADCRMVVTANEGLRGGKRIPLKKIVDRAVEGMTFVETVLVARRTESDVPMRPGRDFWLDEECAKQRSTCTYEWMGAEDPLFILYTSGSTGKPKGLLHTTGGYLTYAALTHRLIFDYHPGDVYFCAADIGWITGHSYIVYGPLANGATTVMFESTPTYPDPGRYWRIVDDLGVNILYTAPTALRALAQAGNDWVKRYQPRLAADPGQRGRAHQSRDLALVPRRGGGGSLRGRGHLVADGDRRHPDHAAARGHPDEGRVGDAALLRRQAGAGGAVHGQGPGGQRRGGRALPRVALARPGPHRVRGPPALSRTRISGPYPGLYFTGDGVRRDEDGYYWITGRIDDVLNVSGHRLGTAEIESALVAHEAVAEAAVVGFPHPIKGQGIYAYVVLTADHAADDQDQVEGALKEQVRHAIGVLRRARRRSTWRAACPRPAAARSCGASCARSPARSTTASVTSRRSRIRRWWTG